MPRTAAKTKRGPKKGYTQSEAHIKKRRIALEKAWATGKFKNRKSRNAKLKKVKHTEKPTPRTEPQKRLVDTIGRRKLKRSEHKIRRTNPRFRKPHRR